MLTELSKVNAPSLLLQDFNYFFNKAINQYVNKRYNIYDVNQQTTDDLRVLKATTILPVQKSNSIKYSEIADWGAGNSKLFAGTYETELPSDYLHLLNCVCIYKLKKNYKCYNQGDYVQFAAKRLTADSWSQIVGDYFNRPLPWRPYYYIHNVNTSITEPTNPYSESSSGSTDQIIQPEVYSLSGIEEKVSINNQDTDSIHGGHRVLVDSDSALFTNYFNTCPYTTDVAFYYDSNNRLYYVKSGQIMYGYYLAKDTYWSGVLHTKGQVRFTNTATPDGSEWEAIMLQHQSQSTGYSRTFKLTDSELPYSVVDKTAGIRHSNASSVRMELRFGDDNSVFELQKVLVDYLKSPQYIRLTQEQVNLIEDTSQIMEFPDYVCQEIINELTMLVMQNIADPRLQTKLAVSQSIANPAQQQTVQPQVQQAAS